MIVANEPAQTRCGSCPPDQVADPGHGEPALVFAALLGGSTRTWHHLSTGSVVGGARSPSISVDGAAQSQPTGDTI
jgi:hypothetical protein